MAVIDGVSLNGSQYSIQDTAAQAAINEITDKIIQDATAQQIAKSLREISDAQSIMTLIQGGVAPEGASISDIKELLSIGVGRYGVSGVGGSAAKLTRVWDAADFPDPVPSTDTVQGSSPFDNIKPFNRRKCVGSWSKDPNSAKAVFTVNAYFGDGDYTEDGSNGDYVAIDVEPFYYYQYDGVIAVSEYRYPGFAIHPVCVDADGNIRKHTYIPAYAMAMVGGHPVSLPGYENERGGYATHISNARKYNNDDAKAYAIIEPVAVMHYEWLLMTIEYATQNMQTFINGAVSIRYNETDIITALPAANQIIVGAGGAYLVVGQSIYLGATHDASVNVDLYNHITEIQRCDETGTVSEEGAYYLITYDGTDRTNTLVAGTSKFGSRPWITGATAGYAHGVHAVIGHTGSPVDLLNGRYPMRYRWRENVYGNQNMTLLDLMNVRIDEGDEVYHLDWYHLSDPRKATASNPSKATLTNPANGWTKLSVYTPSAEYKNGYIRELTPDTAHPHIRIPTVMTGASATTYVCDYAYLAISSEVRAVRRGGTVTNGANAGPCCLSAYTAPSNASWHFGAALFFIQ